MKTIEQQKQIADEILEKIFLMDSYAIVAGGAPRDWYFNRVAEDIDVFFYENVTTEQTEKKLKKAGFEILRTNSGESLPNHYKMNPNLATVFDCLYEGEKIQFLKMNKPTFKSVVPQFPLSICKAWYKNGKLCVDTDFKRAVKHNAIVKTNTLYANEHVYLQKILSKFPEYTYHESWESLAQHLLNA